MKHLTDRLNAACASYFDTPFQPQAIMAGYDTTLRGTSLCYVLPDWSVYIVNVYSEAPPKKEPKNPGKRKPGAIPRVPSEQLHAYALDAIAYYTRQYQPAKIVHEDYAFAAKGSSVLDLAEIGGDVRRLLTQYPGEHLLIAPAALKMYTCGKGNGKAGKELMISMMSIKFGIPLADNNMTDALALANWGMCEIIGKKEWKPTSVRTILHTPDVFQNDPLG